MKGKRQRQFELGSVKDRKMIISSINGFGVNNPIAASSYCYECRCSPLGCKMCRFWQARNEISEHLLFTKRLVKL